MSLAIHSLAARVLDTYVVDDNRLAWLPVEPSKTPLHALKQVVSQEVLLVARRNLKGHRND